jgi:hypothetical protein
MFEKCYVNDSDQTWQTIEEWKLRRELTSCYQDIDGTIKSMCQGGLARTYFAFYRWRVNVPTTPYVEYYRRGLITANEWSRLERQAVRLK